MRLHTRTPTLVAQAGPEVSTLGMVAVYPTAEEADALAVEGGLEPADLHCTLVFLGEAEDLPDTDVMTAALEQVAMELAPIAGTVGGIGHFSEGPDGVPVIALPDVQGLTLLRERVVDELGHSGVRSPSEHGFLPHLTLTYADPGTALDLEEAEDKLGRPLTFDTVSLVVAGDRYDYELAGARVAAAEPAAEQAPATPDEIAAATARASERLQSDEHVDPLAAAYQEVLERAARRMSRALTAKATVLADAGDPTEPPRRFVPPDADEVLDAAALAADVGEVLSKAQREAARIVVAELDSEGVAYDVDTVFTDELLDRIGEVATTSIEAEMRDQYRATIEAAAEQGFSVADAAEALSNTIDDLAPHTARAMARTDLNGLSNGGSLHVAQQSLATSEEPVYKTWLATPDERTRDTHEEADGQTVPLNENFRVGLSSLPYPGFPFAPAEEVINCRCTITYTSDPTGREQVVTAEGGSPPSDRLPSTHANEEAPMSTMAADETLTADGDGEIALTPIGWDAVLAVEGEPTEDGRLLERGAISWRDLPLTLMGMLETSDYGHNGAKVAGRIDSITRVANDLTSAGEFTSEFGVKDLAPLIADKTVRGVSVDLAVLDWEYRDRETGATLDEDDLFLYWLEGKESLVLFTVLDGVIVGATVCPMPAIANAEISLAASAGLDPAGRAILAAALGDRKAALADVPLIRLFTPFERTATPLVAAAPLVELEPAPRAHFEISEFPGNTPLTVTEPGPDGWRRVFGHIATWDTCHVGIPGVCTTAPRSYTTPPYALFHQASYLTREGDTLDVGNLMLGTGHAGLAASRADATRHYDRPDMVGARVRATDGEHGIWVSGVVRPELTDAGLRELRENPPSGDWRQYNGHLELVAVCAVAVPGFPVVADAQANITAAGGTVEVSALIASSGRITPTDAVRDAMVAAGCGCDDMETDEGYLGDLADFAVS